MIDRRETYRFAGLADPVGKRSGFLIPVFSNPRSNILLVEEVGSDGSVVDFVPLQLPETTVIELDGDSIKVGEDPHWGFGFGAAEKVIYARGDEKKDLLEKALDDEFLKKRPMLSLEVAEFLDLQERRVSIACDVFRDLMATRGNPDVARRWRDLSVLTTDIRSALARQTATGLHRVDFSRLTARIERSVVIISGVEDNKSAHNAVRNAVQATLKRLKLLYPEYDGGWGVEFRFRSADFRPATPVRHNLEEIRGLVYVADSDTPQFPSRYEVEVDGMGIFQPYQQHGFLSATRETRHPAFALYRLQSDLPPVLPELDGSLVERMPLGIALRVSSSPMIRPNERMATHRYRAPKVIVTTRPPLGYGTRGLGGEVRDALNLFTDAYQQTLQTIPFDTSVFMRVRGVGPYKRSDAWLQMYERCIKLGIENPRGMSFDFEESDQNDDLHARELFLPLIDSIPVKPTVFRGRRAIDAAAIVELNDNVYVEYGRHVQRIRELLNRVNGSDGSGAGPRRGDRLGRFSVSIEPDTTISKKTNYRDRALFSLELENIRHLRLVDEATSAQVLANISEHELLITLRDLGGIGERSPTIWTILASQMRRFAGGMAGRSRTHYFAMLCNAAFQQGRISMREPELFDQMLHSHELGESIHLVTSQPTFEDGYVSLSLRPVFRNYDRLEDFRYGELSRLRLAVDGAGPRLEEDGYHPQD